MNIPEFTEVLNAWGNQKTPFFFIIDFELAKPVAWKLSDVNPIEIKYNIHGFSNTSSDHLKKDIVRVAKFPNPFEAYEKKFKFVFDHLRSGYSFLTNLTDKTKITVDKSLVELFLESKAAYKLLYKEEFLVFSPESFIQIKNNKIYSFPMKGTIDASIPSAKEKILGDAKELAEHITIVDLIRNDLSQVASHVVVKRFRYVEEVKTQEKNLLQVSSEIVGELKADYASHIGDLIVSLLPAGSVSGAPKAKTLEIIRAAEIEKRGYYTGVFGYFDGVNLDSGVMIRYIEKRGEQLFYRSGGGITAQSNAAAEYQELIDKIYVPID